MEENAEHIITKDADGNALTGGKHYVFHLSPDIPAKEFWSVIVYDSKTRLIIKNDQMWPSVYATSKGLKYNKDGSIDVFFGPGNYTGNKNNWIQTIPGKEWTMVLRLYGTTESWHNQTWMPCEIEAIK